VHCRSRTPDVLDVLVCFNLYYYR